MAADQEDHEINPIESPELKSLRQLLIQYMISHSYRPKIRNLTVIDLQLKIKDRKALEKRWAFRTPDISPTLVFERVCPLCQKIGHQDGYDFHLRERHHADYMIMMAVPSFRSGQGRGVVMVGGGQSKKKN